MADTDTLGNLGVRIVERSGSVRNIDPPTMSSVVSWNRDGTKLLFSAAKVVGAFVDCDTYVYDMTTRLSTPVPGLIRPDRDEVMAIWAPDGSIIAVTAPHQTGIQTYVGNTKSLNSGTSRIVHLQADGTEKVLTGGVEAAYHYYPSVSPDGRWLAFNTSALGSYASNDAKLWILPMDGSAPARELANANGTYLDDKGASIGYGNSWPQWSPDSAWIAFSSNRPLLQPDGTMSNDWSLYIAAVNGNGLDSIALPIPGASRPGIGEHVTNWFF